MFEIGQRVQVASDYFRAGLAGKQGTVVCYSTFLDEQKAIGVEIDSPGPDCHDLDGRLEGSNGRYFLEENLRSIDNSPSCLDNCSVGKGEYGGTNEE